jgi:hypothetical protein
MATLLRSAALDPFPSLIVAICVSCYHVLHLCDSHTVMHSLQDLDWIRVRIVKLARVPGAGISDDVAPSCLWHQLAQNG